MCPRPRRAGRVSKKKSPKKNGDKRRKQDIHVFGVIREDVDADELAKAYWSLVEDLIIEDPPDRPEDK